MKILDICIYPKQPINYIEEHQGFPQEGEQCVEFMLPNIKTYLDYSKTILHRLRDR